MFTFIRSGLKFIVVAFLVFASIGVLIGMFLVNKINHAINPNAGDIFSECGQLDMRHLGSTISSQERSIADLKQKGLDNEALEAEWRLKCLTDARAKFDASSTPGGGDRQVPLCGLR